MSLVIKGVELTQEQINVILPIINRYSQKPRLDKLAMERECLEAMEHAGCPLAVQSSRER